ncbi:MAG: 2-oxoacid:acceptor oxidoreductase subunit alpha [Tissierellia bacterium]|nr:2-oxoacid:acceptor oxidoreductase subunit alpha [Tissierellia bacterium]
MNKKALLMQGNEACVRGALYAGMRFYSGYPITPSTEIAEMSAVLLPTVGGAFIQMEDEIGGIAAAIGASIAGKKAMTATSGPGFTLKMENLGYAVMSEIPLVIVDVQRGGPSTGLPTQSSQADVMQTKWGSHGDNSLIVLSPNSVTETFYLTVEAFNLAEKYRTPVVILTDEVIGHAREKIILPEPGEIEIFDRLPPLEDRPYRPFGVEEGDKVPRFAAFGTGYRYNITGLYHNESGFPSNSQENAKLMLERIHNKLKDEEIIKYEKYQMEDAEYVFLAFGSTSRSAVAAVNELRAEGYKVGLFRPITIWPSPEKAIDEIASKVEGICVAEMNLGQYVLEVERIAAGRTKVSHLGRANGDILRPEEFVNHAKEYFNER